MTKSFHEVIQSLGAKYVGDVPDPGTGALGAALLAHILQERLQPGHGKRPGRPTDPDWLYRQRHVPMSEETSIKLDVLVEKINQHTERKVNRAQVAALLLENAVARELAHQA